MCCQTSVFAVCSGDVITRTELNRTELFVQEHAYYLDFQNARPAYINTYMDKLVSWDAIAERYAAATA